MAFGNFVYLLIFPLIGAFFALPIALPFIRHRARTNQKFRIGIIIICSLVALLVPFSAIVDLNTGLAVFYSTPCIENYETDNCRQSVSYELRDKLYHEVGMRHLLPPPWREHCFTGIPEVCEAANQWNRSWDWDHYLNYLLITAIFACFTAFIGWYVTRTGGKKKRKTG